MLILMSFLIVVTKDPILNILREEEFWAYGWRRDTHLHGREGSMLRREARVICLQLGRQVAESGQKWGWVLNHQGLPKWSPSTKISPALKKVLQPSKTELQVGNQVFKCVSLRGPFHIQITIVLDRKCLPHKRLKYCLAKSLNLWKIF